MDGGAIVLIILGVMFTAITVYAVIVRGRERAREWERRRRLASHAPSVMSARDAADNFSEGLRLLRTCDFPAAVLAFSASISLDQDNWTAYFRRAEAYRKLGMVVEARRDIARAEFLMRLARHESEGRGASSDGVVADINVDAVVGRVIGVIVGAVVGFVVGCIMGFLYACALTGPAGAFCGGVAGYRAGGGDFGCAGGCLAVIAVWVILIVTATLS